jgi:hypothetical protein
MLQNADAKCNQIVPSYYNFPFSCVLMHHSSYANLIHKTVSHHKERMATTIVNSIHQKVLATCQILVSLIGMPRYGVPAPCQPLSFVSQDSIGVFDWNAKT